MKNTKAIFFIILGSFLLATGFAYAEEDKPAMAQLKAWAGSSQVAASAVDPAAAAQKSVPAGSTKGVELTAQTKAAAPAVPKATAAPEAPKEPTSFEKFKKWWTREGGQSMVISALAIGLLGFLIIGTLGGGLLVGAAAFGFFYGTSKM